MFAWARKRVQTITVQYHGAQQATSAHGLGHCCPTVEDFTSNRTHNKGQQPSAHKLDHDSTASIVPGAAIC